jgi:membrane-bound lytic murein transglycosylase A
MRLKFSSRYLTFTILLLFIAVLFYGCLQRFSGRLPSRAAAARYSSGSMKLVTDSYSSFLTGDDLSRDSLNKAITQSLKYLNIIPADRIFFYGKVPYPAHEVIASMTLFQEILAQNYSYERLVSELEDNYYAFASSANRGKQVLFTGYYEPISEGALAPSATFNVPVYTLPEDLVVLELGEFRESLKNRTIVYRMENGKLQPYYSRQQIMEQKVLSGQKKEIAWMKDPIDLFFMQVQGSGILLLPTGNKIKLSYAGANGRRYSSIGKLLIEEGKMELEAVSMGSIRRYLNSHPEERDRILYHNKSYTFFNPSEDSGHPRGNLNVPLTPHRSIATDTEAFPKAALGFVSSELPIFDENGNLKEWRHFSRFVVNQDTGGAIKGADRLDLFWGNGALAAKSAGTMRRFGTLYLFIAKKEILAKLTQKPL